MGMQIGNIEELLKAKILTPGLNLMYVSYNFIVSVESIRKNYE